jgi:tRNA nucleotidyltransferase (CCA-adding enzyme)
MRDIFTKENIRMFNELSEKHGTVCVRMMETDNYEITTLRIDKVTDGRRAGIVKIVIEFCIR